MTGQRFLLVSAAMLAAAGLVLLGDRAYHHAKGRLARHLVASAWDRYLEDGGEHRPWPWADFHPIGRIEVPRLGFDRIVLTGATGSALAFGLGHVSGTALPGRPGSCAVAGHRDRWARFLRDLHVGDEIRVQTREGIESLRVASLDVVSRDRIDVLEPGGATRLTILTCFPIEGLFPSRKRFVVRCEREAAELAPRRAAS